MQAPCSQVLRPCASFRLRCPEDDGARRRRQRRKRAGRTTPSSEERSPSPDGASRRLKADLFPQGSSRHCSTRHRRLQARRPRAPSRELQFRNRAGNDNRYGPLVVVPALVGRIHPERAQFSEHREPPSRDELQRPEPDSHRAQRRDVGFDETHLRLPGRN